MDILVSGPFAITMLTEKLGSKFTDNEIDKVTHDMAEKIEHSHEQISEGHIDDEDIK
ncbi:MAG: hypothetical protein R2883_00830 [Caldisericia bacterium]